MRKTTWQNLQRRNKDDIVLEITERDSDNLDSVNVFETALLAPKQKLRDYWYATTNYFTNSIS